MDVAGWLDVAGAEADCLNEFGLTGVVAAGQKLASWAQAAELAAVAQVASRAAAADKNIGVGDDGRPARVCRDATGQVSLALTMSDCAAAAWADLAVTLSWRLPATGQALAAGKINLYRARRIAEATSVLSEAKAREVEAKILPCAGQLTPAKLRERLTQIRQELFDVSMDETLLGISAVAAPILNFDNELVGVIAIVGTTQDVHEPVDPEQLKLLRACTKAISMRLNSTAYEGLGIPNFREFIFD